MTAVTTQPLYRVPDLPASDLVAMLANIEAEGGVALATVAVRQALWRSGGSHARLAERLNHDLNTWMTEVATGA